MQKNFQQKYRAIEESQDEFYEEIVNRSSIQPEEIDIAIETKSLDSIISKIETGMIDMNTQFQRNSNLWSNVKMSRLIESVFLKIPLPVSHWHEIIGESNIADAFCDRLLHSAHRIELKGESLRKNFSE